MSTERRYRVLYIEHDVVLDILRGSLTTTDFDVPDDAQVIGIFEDPARLALGIVIQSKMFANVPLGQEMPQLPPFQLKRAATADAVWKAMEG